MRKKKKEGVPELTKEMEIQQLYRATNIVRFLLQFMRADKHLELFLFVLCLADQNKSKYTRGNKVCQSYETECRIAIIQREGKEFEHLWKCV